MKQQTSKDKEEISKLKHDIKNANLKIEQLEKDKTQLTTDLTNRDNNNEWLVKQRNDLQTKYDMEVKNKEKLTETLSIYQQMPIMGFSTLSNIHREKFFYNPDESVPDFETVKKQKEENLFYFYSQHTSSYGNSLIDIRVYFDVKNTQVISFSDYHMTKRIEIITQEFPKYYAIKKKNDNFIEVSIDGYSSFQNPTPRRETWEKRKEIVIYESKDQHSPEIELVEEKKLSWGFRFLKYKITSLTM